VETLFLTVISLGTLRNLYAQELTLNKKWFPSVTLETTVRNKVPDENILVGTLFMEVISRRT
jgi:hypothetical protein